MEKQTQFSRVQDIVPLLERTLLHVSSVKLTTNLMSLPRANDFGYKYELRLSNSDEHGYLSSPQQTPLAVPGTYEIITRYSYDDLPVEEELFANSNRLLVESLKNEGCVVFNSSARPPCVETGAEYYVSRAA